MPDHSGRVFPVMLSEYIKLRLPSKPISAGPDCQVDGTRGKYNMETLQLEKLCSWLKQRLVTSKQSYVLNCATKNVPPGTADRPRESPTKGRKRKITWEILHPFKHRRLEREEKEPVTAVYGNFGLTEVRGAMFPGHQSTATSLCAILRSQTTEPSSWTSDIIDKLMIQGDRLHSVRLDNLERQPIYQTSLEPEELPTNICMNRNEYKISLTRVLPECTRHNGVEFVKDDDIKGTLSEILGKCLRRCNSGFLMSKAGTFIAIFSDGTHIYLFNPNKKISRHVLLSSKHLSVLQKFRDTKHLATYLLPKLAWEGTVKLWRVDFVVDCISWSQIPTLPRQPWV